MKKSITLFTAIMLSLSSFATIHVIRVWSGYYQFLPPTSINNCLLGDTIQWLPLDFPGMTHTITSTTIPSGATAFDQIWKMPADTFFQYIPQVSGTYNYVCTPHAPGMGGSFNVTSSTEIVENGTTFDYLSVYPNPASNSISITNLKRLSNYRILNIKGEVISTGTTKDKIDIAEISSGIYYIELLGEQKQILKMIKL